MVPGCFFAVVDIKKVYRSIPVFANHRKYRHFCRMYQFYQDKLLCFGLSCAHAASFSLRKFWCKYSEGSRGEGLSSGEALLSGDLCDVI